MKLHQETEQLVRAAATRAARATRTAAVKKRTGLSRATIYRLERAGRFPKRVKISDNTVGWPEAEVIAWNANRPRAK